MKLRVLISLFVLTAICSISLLAQDVDDPLAPAQLSKPIYIGPIAGANITMHNVTLRSFSWDAACPEFSTGAGMGFYGGLSIEYLIGEARTSTSSVIARVMYNTFPGNFKEDGDSYPSLLENTEKPIESVTEHTLDVTYNLASLDLLYKINPIPGMGFGIVAGPTIDFAMTKSMLQKYSLISPNNIKFKELSEQEMIDLGINIVRYEDAGRTIVVRDGSISEAIAPGRDDASSIRFGLKVGAQYTISMKGFVVVPNVMYNYSLTTLTSTESWRVNALQVGVDVRIALVIF